MGNCLSKVLTSIACVALIVVAVICPPLGSLTPLLTGALFGGGVGGLTTLVMGGSVSDVWKSIGLGMISGCVGAGAGMVAQMACGSMSICNVTVINVVKTLSASTAVCVTNNLVTGQPLFKNLGHCVIGAAFTCGAAYFLGTESICNGLVDAIRSICGDLAPIMTPIIAPFVTRTLTFLPDYVFAKCVGEKAPSFGAYMAGAAAEAIRCGVVMATKHAQEFYSRTGKRTEVVDSDRKLAADVSDTEKNVVISDDKHVTVKRVNGRLVIVVKEQNADAQRKDVLLGESQEPREKILQCLRQHGGDDARASIVGSPRALTSTLTAALAESRNNIDIFILDDNLDTKTATRNDSGRIRRVPPRSATSSASRSNSLAPPSTSSSQRTPSSRGGAFVASASTLYSSYRIPVESCVRKRRKGTSDVSLPPLILGTIRGFVCEGSMKTAAKALQQCGAEIVAEVKHNGSLALLVNGITLPHNWCQLVGDVVHDELDFLCEAAVLPILSETRDVQKPGEHQSRLNCEIKALQSIIEQSSIVVHDDDEVVPWAIIAVLGSRAAQASSLRSMLQRRGYVYHEQWFSGMCPTGIWAFVCARHRIVFLDVDMRQLRTVATAISMSSQVLLVHESDTVTLETVMVFVHALHYTVKFAEDKGDATQDAAAMSGVNENFARQLQVASKCGKPFLVTAGISRDVPSVIEEEALLMLQSVLGGHGVQALDTSVDFFTPQLPHYLSMMHPSKGALTAPLVGQRSFGDSFCRALTRNFKVMDSLTSTQIKSDFDAAQKRSSQYVDGRLQLAFKKVCEVAEKDKQFAEAFQAWTTEFSERCQSAKTLLDLASGLIDISRFLWTWNRHSLAMEILFSAYDRSVQNDEQQPQEWNRAWVQCAQRTATQRLIWAALTDAVDCQIWAWRFLACTLGDTEDISRSWLNLARPTDGMPLLSIAVKAFAERPNVAVTVDSQEIAVTEAFTTFVHLAFQTYEGFSRLSAHLLTCQRYGQPSPFDVVAHHRPRGPIALYTQSCPARPSGAHTLGMRPLNEFESVDIFEIAVRKCSPSKLETVATYDIIDSVLAVGFQCPKSPAAFVKLLREMLSSRVVTLATATQPNSLPLPLLRLDPSSVAHGSPFRALSRLPTTEMLPAVSQLDESLHIILSTILAGLLNETDETRSHVFCTLATDVLLPAAHHQFHGHHELYVPLSTSTQGTCVIVALLVVSASHKLKRAQSVSSALRRLAAFSNVSISMDALPFSTGNVISLFLRAWSSSPLTASDVAWGFSWILQHAHYLTGMPLNGGTPFAQPSQLPQELVNPDAVQSAWGTICSTYVVPRVWLTLSAELLQCGCSGVAQQGL
ncbi:GPI-anchored surface protein, putative [Bodo saltans]|uniref:GPI-anchored surface protein, putative n=1 Tax=Bodo saltans TaxID=75058 RepID=A0A0S4IL17_BODSA|nr:GPI-anchored surface protein, putative [Bodo saltans]|eukprot:CUE70200.1 GPI-anchored surface protein, putative [Bodo saltans]